MYVYCSRTPACSCVSHQFLSSSLNCEWPKATQYVKGGLDSTLSSGRSAILWPSVGLLCHLHCTHLYMWEATSALRPSIHIPREGISFILISLSLMLDSLLKMISLVTWEHLGRIIKCLVSNGKVEFSRLPPTLISPWSFVKGSNLNRWLCLVSLGFCSLWIRLAISFLNADQWSSLKIRISASCHWATAVVTVFGLFFLKVFSGIRSLQQPFQLENLDTLIRLKDSLSTVMCTVALTFGSPIWILEISSLLVGIFFSYWTSWTSLVLQHLVLSRRDLLNYSWCRCVHWTSWTSLVLQHLILLSLDRLDFSWCQCVAIAWCQCLICLSVLCWWQTYGIFGVFLWSQPKVLFKIGVVKFFLKHHANFRGNYCSGELRW